MSQIPRQKRLEAMANAYESPYEAATAQRILYGYSLPIEWMQEVYASAQFKKVAPPCPACGHDHAKTAAMCDGDGTSWHFCSHSVVDGRWQNWSTAMQERFKDVGYQYYWADA